MENNKPTLQINNINRYVRDGDIMLFSGILLFLVIVIILFFHGYIQRILNFRRRRHILSLSNNVAAARGLDRSILKALPVLVYGSKTHEHELECAVCLSEFQDGEKGWVLPKCKHTFHICCIDMWFQSHSNCPLCRAPVHYDNVSEYCAQTVVPVVETAVLPSELRQKIEDETGCSASSSPATSSLALVQCPRISSDLAGILVEVPTITGEQRLTNLWDMGLDASGPRRPKLAGDPSLSV